MDFAAALKKAKAAKRKSSETSGGSSNKKSSGKTVINSKQVDTGDATYKAPVNFIIIGVQKAGTSAAVVNLSKHPDVWLKPGQVHFFDRWYQKGLSYYRSLLKPDKSGVKLIGEKTPTYIYCDGCMERIKDVAPNTKFLLFLREPISRAFSQWNMLKNNMKQEDLSFGEACDRELTTLMGQKRSFGNALAHYIQRGFYMDQIERFLKVFPKEQLLVVIAERIRANPVEEHQRIFDFLGVDKVEIEAEDVHLGKYKDTLPPRVKEKLKEVYRPHNERLYEWLGGPIEEWTV